MNEIELMRLRVKVKAKAARERQAQQKLQETTEKSALFPMASQVQGQGIGPSAARIGLGTIDVVDAPKRALAYITGQGDMSDPEANVWAKPREAFRDYIDKMASKVPEDKKVKTLVAAPMGGEPQYIEQTGQESINDWKMVGDTIFEVVGDPLMTSAIIKSLGGKAAIEIGKLGVKAIVEAPRKIAGAAARSLTKIPEETLLKYASKEGRAELAKAYAKEPATAAAMVRKVYKQKLPEEALVDQFIQQANDIPIQPLIDALEESKVAIKLPKSNKGAISEIDNLIEDYAGMGEKLTAAEFREVRKELDDVLGDVYEKEGLSAAKKAIKGVRSKMRDLLINASPKEYKEIMEVYASKMDARSEIKELLGKDAGWKAKKKAEALLTGLENSGKTQEHAIVSKFDDIYGTNFTKRAETMHEARQLAAEPGPPSGKFEASLLPKVSTGWGAMASTVVGLGWPRTSGKVLNVISGLEKATKTVGYKLPAAILDNSNAKMVQSLTAALKPLSQEKIDKLNKLIEGLNKTKDEKMKGLYSRNINSILGGK